jgi:type I restriction enzyme S subunit
MREGWELKKLGDIATVSSGNSAPQKKEFFEDGIFPFIRTSDVGQIRKGFISSCVDYLNKEGIKGLKLYKKGTILFPKSGASTFLNHRVLMEMDSYVSSHLATIKGNNSITDDKFLLYFLTTIDARDLMQDIAYPSLKTSEISLIPIPLPPLPEQQRIVAILDECFAALEKAKANAEQNLKNAKELFESYLQGVFENGDWETKKLNQISENLDSKRVPITKNIRSSGEIPYYGASGIVDYVADYLFDENLLCISEDGANLLARTYPIAFSISGKTWVNNHAHVLKFPNIVTQKFVEVYINSIRIDDYVSGMAQPKLNQAMLNKIPIPIPSIEDQQAIVHQLDALRAETQKLEAVYQQKLADLEELKKSILQKAFAGELTDKSIAS